MVYTRHFIFRYYHHSKVGKLERDFAQASLFSELPGEATHLGWGLLGALLFQT